MVKVGAFEQQVDEDITITDPATLARTEITENQPAKIECEIQDEARSRDLESATKCEEDAQWHLDIEERLRKAYKAIHEAPIDDPRAAPTMEPPRDHYDS
ncbi:hypothetical protein N7533_009616 [Penicillium manginii]|uniref:uncharacterized protein n=1 Tax=Penicillium manginii TaxID=203109 RepID=UPI0025486C00|nr:uncharacterized protein N7533_009616 [Penicillium manginii]KAJ5744746.1 hypothetical protein N7533_009616 [Penicillium manginii]